MDRAALFVERSLTLIGGGLVVVAGLLSAIMVGSGRAEILSAPVAVVSWLWVSGAFHLFAGHPDAAQRTRWLAVASEIPVLAALAGSSWPRPPGSQEIGLLALLATLPTMTSIGLLLSARSGGGP
jgi:hypothetical protein